MSFLRRTLMLVSLAGALFFAVLLKTEGWHYSSFEIAFVVIGAVVLGANFIYMMQGPAHEPRTRLGRMIRLWLDAKEKELATRAGSRDN